jgi:FkbM family methyltransferase
MSFISYAQNYEDVMLWRALKHVKSGFYIDVGAAWPDEHSVTKAFYDKGWRGINIEPNPIHHASLMNQRPRDINLQLAIGEQPGEQVMHFVGDTGLSTLDFGIAEQHQQSGRDVDHQTIRVTPLADVCKAHIPNGQDIHFLKIDVEGFELQALNSNNWKMYRPWVLLVEATLPMSQIESYKDWEPIVLDSGYSFAYADGLNRFYVADEQSKLLMAFKHPPNVFDAFVLNSQKQAEVKAQLAEASSNQYLSQLNSVYDSSSWRITRPLRWIAHQKRLIDERGLSSRAKSFIRKMGLKAIHEIRSRPQFKRAALRVLNRLPWLKSSLIRIAKGLPANGRRQPLLVPGDIAQLSPHARRMHLRHASATRKFTPSKEDR